MKNLNFKSKNYKVGMPFQFLLFIFLISIIIYTSIAIQNSGWNLFNVYFNNLLSFNWSGQFNLDFSTYLVLSGLWVGWRHNFSLKGFILCLSAMILGILFFAPYLLILSYQENGDLKAILLGEQNN